MSTTAYLLRRWSCTNSTMKEKNKHLLENIWLYVSCKDVQLLFSVFYFCMFHKCIFCLLLKLSYYATFSFRNVDLFPKNCILHYVVNWFFEPFWTNSNFKKCEHKQWLNIQPIGVYRVFCISISQNLCKKLKVSYSIFWKHMFSLAGFLQSCVEYYL